MLQLICEIFFALVLVYLLYLGLRMVVWENKCEIRIDKKEEPSRKSDDNDKTANKKNKKQ